MCGCRKEHYSGLVDMASQGNRFAGLASDFAAEEARKKKAADVIKAKKEAEKAKEEAEHFREKESERAAKKGDSEGFTTVGGASHAPSDRARGQPYRGGRSYRGERGRGDRSRGGFTRGGMMAYAPKQREGEREVGDHHFPGSGDPVHPYDRRSGTGRGTEISKRGGGARNWGRPEDDWTQEEHVEKVVQKEKEHDERLSGEPVSEKVDDKDKDKDKETEKGKETGKEETEPRRGRRDKRKGKKDFKEEKKEEDELDPYGTAVTYQEYQAQLAEKQKGLPSKKPVEVQVDPSKTAGLVSYQKPLFVPAPSKESAPKSKDESQPEVEGQEKDKEVLGKSLHHSIRRLYPPGVEKRAQRWQTRWAMAWRRFKRCL